MDFGGTWMAQLVEHPILGFGTGRDPRVMGLSPKSGTVLNMVPAQESLSPFQKTHTRTCTHTTHLGLLDT